MLWGWNFRWNMYLFVDWATNMYLSLLWFNIGMTQKLELSYVDIIWQKIFFDAHSYISGTSGEWISALWFYLYWKGLATARQEDWPPVKWSKVAGWWTSDSLRKACLTQQATKNKVKEQNPFTNAKRLKGGDPIILVGGFNPFEKY